MAETLPAQFIQEAEERYTEASKILKETNATRAEELTFQIALGHLAAHIAEVKLLGRQRL